MGLDTSHDAFSGAYSAFNRFRQVVVKAAGGSYPPHEIPLVLDGQSIENPDQSCFYIPDWEQFQQEHPGLSAFIVSNDCVGEFPPDLCLKMADEMEALLPEIEKEDINASGHIARDGGFSAVAKRYIAGCRLAHSLGETLVYA